MSMKNVSGKLLLIKECFLSGTAGLYPKVSKLTALR